MKCPTDEIWLSRSLSELSVAQSRALDDHAESCPSCAEIRKEQLEVLDELRALPAFGSSQEEFLSQVLTRCRDAEPIPAVKGVTSSWLRLGGGVLGGLCVAAAVAFVIGRASPSTESWSRRGSAPTNVAETSVQAFVLRGNGLEPLQGATLGSGDRIAVSYSNNVEEPRYLAVFAVDAASTVHWIYPAFPDETANPQSIRLEPKVIHRMLSEVVEPEAPAEGSFKVFAAVTREPLWSRDVEDRLRARRGSIRELFVAVSIQEWSCEWHAR